jgi:OOP family OmpA-OmpF porin
VKISRLFLAAIVAAAGAATGAAQAQSKQGYWTEPAGADAVWKSGTGLCWRAGYWTPAMAIAECDPDLVPRPAPKPAPAPAPKPAPKPAAKPAAPKPQVLTVVLQADETFDSNKSVIKPAARARLDDVVAKLRAFKAIKVVNVQGHTDRLGSAQYNQKLSERRAEAVKAYLASKGIDAGKIETFGFGKTLSVKNCPDDKNRKALNECLAPNRRAVIEGLEQL